MDDAALEGRLFTRAVTPSPRARPVPDWTTVHQELKRKGVTLQLLWHEYQGQHPDGYQYTQFCQHYHTWAATLKAACARARVTGPVSYRSVKSMLATSVDQLPLPSLNDAEALAPSRLPPTHEHVRGPEYYAQAAPVVSS